MTILAIYALIESKQKCEIGIFNRIASGAKFAVHCIGIWGAVHKIFLRGAITFEWLYFGLKPFAIELFFLDNTILFLAQKNLQVRLLIYLVVLPKNFAF